MIAVLEQVLAYWLGTSPLGDQEYRRRLPMWFGGDEAVDRELRERFGEHVETAAAGTWDAEASTPRGVLALVLLLDQLPRNIHRGTARAYAHDARALALCRTALARGLDERLGPVERTFLYLPLQHSEDLADQRRSVALMDRLVQQTPEGDWFHPHARHGLTMARLHERLIERYGRFPHRNAVLGRPSTLPERMYLDAGGTTFGQVTTAAATDEPARFAIVRPSLDPARTVCVDGRVEGLRCLSHWPGAEPPEPLRHDLSTGMALRWARLPADERERLLGRFSIVTNDHYDTDGVLAAFALLHPERALAHEDLMVRTATTGDFRTFEGPDALAVDLTLTAWRSSPRSPLAAALAAASDHEAHAELCYHHALQRLPGVLADPFAHRELWADRFDRVMADIERVDAGLVPVERHPELDLAVVYADGPLTRIGLVRAAAGQYRVLLVTPGERGTHYRFLYRNESWFLGVRDRVSPRVPLGPAIDALNALEPHDPAAAPEGARWWCTGLDQTSPQLGFGDPSGAANVFGDLRPDLDPPSALPPSTVVEHLAAVLTAHASLLRSA